MTSKKVGYSEMYMVPPSVWELVKKCVNEHEQKLLDDINKDTSISMDSNKSKTSSIIQDISSRDITPLEPSISSNLDLSKPSNPHTPRDEIDQSQSETSYHRSIDRSRSFINPNISFNKSKSSINPNISTLSGSQIPLPESSFEEQSFQPINISQHSTRSKIDLNQPSFQSNDSFGRLPPPENISPTPYVHDPEDYDLFIPRNTSSPINQKPLIPILPLPECSKRLPRSPIKTRTKTGSLPQQIFPRNNQFICDYCNKHFARKWNLKKHINTIHLQEIAPDPDQPPITAFKRKQQTDFSQPLLKRKNFDQWDV